MPPVRAPEGEFEFDQPGPDDDANQLRRAADRTMINNARRASLDPDDGIDL